MQRLPVKSSNIKSIGHDPETNKLHVEFNSGKVFEYDGVTAEDHSSLMACESIGKGFQNIKGRCAFKCIN